MIEVGQYNSVGESGAFTTQACYILGREMKEMNVELVRREAE